MPQENGSDRRLPAGSLADQPAVDFCRRETPAEVGPSVGSLVLAVTSHFKRIPSLIFKPGMQRWPSPPTHLQSPFCHKRSRKSGYFPMKVLLQVAQRDVRMDSKAPWLLMNLSYLYEFLSLCIFIIMNLILSLRGTLYRYFVCSCEWWVEHSTVCLGRSENNFQVLVLSFYLVGP